MSSVRIPRHVTLQDLGTSIQMVPGQLPAPRPSSHNFHHDGQFLISDGETFVRVIDTLELSEGSCLASELSGWEFYILGECCPVTNVEVEKERAVGMFLNWSRTLNILDFNFF